MTATATYDALRHLADSWGLMAMALTFLAFALWPFRPGAGDHVAAATMIFDEDRNDV